MNSRLVMLLVGVGATLTLMALAQPAGAQTETISFGQAAALQGETSTNPTSLQFGPDGRLYVAQQNGLIKVYTVKRNAANDYSATNTETIDVVQKIPNHNDDGSVNTTITTRQVTGILVAGTAANPVIYVSSSDPRIGGGSTGEDKNLDTNSGIISRLTWNGSSWAKQDLVRGLPRSEENHSVNGMQLSGGTLYVTVGGNTNQGAPSNNFALLPEFALSTAVLSIDLGAIGNTTYDLPTLDDGSRTNVSAGVDQGDPFGGNDGNNQAKLVSGGPLQIHATGFRNAYDLVIAGSGNMYTIDNGGNAGWGDKPIGVNTPSCTNEVSEPGATNQDNFHLVSSGYYGGHPNPTRANKANTFGGQSPVEVAADPVECNYDKPASNTLTTFPASTNGIDEYTASNFGGAMKGNLLTASFDGTIYRLLLNDTGIALASKEPLFQNFGTTPLDVTTQGDNDPFPGTVWAATYGSDEIIAFEPVANQTCDTSNPDGDADGDGYTNSDEQSSGTDPCSAGDVPPDYDNDKVSNKTDPDDDNDGKSDTSDPFAIDPNNGKTTTLPVRYTWDPGAPNPGGLEGSFGFTGLMTNVTSDYETLYDPDMMTVGGAAGAFTVDEVPEGDALKTNNNQKYAFQTGVNVGPTSGVFTAHARVMAPFAGITPQDYQSMGLHIGTGDQDNYAKLVVSANGGSGGLEFAKEVGGTFSSKKTAASVLGSDFVDLYLTVDPAAGKVQPGYTVTTNGQTGPRTNLGTPVAIPAGWVDGTGALAAGFISSSKGPAPPFAATWDFIEVVAGDGSEGSSTPKASFTIDAGGTLSGSSTFNSGAFKIKNTSTETQKIKNFKIDLSPGVLPDMVFDPNGTAGDTTAKCLTADSGAAATGYISPADNCKDPFSQPHGGNASDGYDVATVSFNDFDPGETFTFSVDVDPTSIKGFSGSGGAGSVSGLELTGALATVGFDDGSSQTAQTFRIPSSVSGSQNDLEDNPPAKPTIEVVGVSAPAKVQQADQTVRVSGPAGSAVSLMVLEGGMLTKPANGFYDLDPYEANSAVAVAEKSATIGSGGTVDLPVTLTKSSTAAGLNYMVAVIKDASGRNGPNSNVVVLEYDDSAQEDTTPPTVTGKTPADGASDVAPTENVTATFSEAMDPTTIDANTFTLTEQGSSSPVTATVSLSADGAKATLDPGADLKASTTYVAKVSTAAKDLAGNALASAETWSFTTSSGTSTSSGLTGQYYDDQNLNVLTLTRTDPKVDFNWGTGSPHTSIAPDTFSVRWGGQVKTDHSEAYTFYVTSNDGVRLWVDGNQIINRWVDGAKTDTGTTTLQGGQWHDIKLEYYEGVKSASIKLEYASASTPKQVVPSENLRTTSDQSDTTPPTVTGKTPADGATSVAVGTNVTATFSEAMDPTTIDANTFTLTEQGSSSPVTATVSLSADGAKATLDPGADLKASTTYVAKVSTAAKDLAGNALASAETWSFTTAASSGSSYGLQVSAQADRSSPVALEGATVSGNIYVFTAPDTGVSQVAFWLDDPNMTGTPKRVEKQAPYDLAGGTVSTANPFDTTKVADGSHTITAKLTLTNGSTEVVSSSFSVKNAP